MEKENQFEPAAVPEKPELKEYSAEAGVAKTVALTERLLESQKYVVIAISGSAVDVGNTYIDQAIKRELMLRDISFAQVGSIGTFMTKPIFEKRRKGGRVLVFETESPVFGPVEEGKRLQNKWLKERIKEKKLRLPISKIDIRIYVYRPDKPFTQDVDLRGADILIKNEGAVNDRRKIRKMPVD